MPLSALSYTFSFYRIKTKHKIVDIDGRPSLSSFQSVVAREEIAAIDPDFVEAEASVPDGIR